MGRRTGAGPCLPPEPASPRSAVARAVGVGWEAPNGPIAGGGAMQAAETEQRQGARRGDHIEADIRGQNPPSLSAYRPGWPVK